MSQSSQRQWSLGRFLQTLTFFQSLPVINWFQKLMGATLPPPQLQSGLLFDFRQPTADLNQVWGALDDVVMGGVSDSSLQFQEHVACFTGEVSTANSGGFASVRTRDFDPPLDLCGYTGVELRVKGDGKRYKFLIRDEDSWDSVAYSYSFDTTPDQWLTVQIPFSQMTPVFRAKTIDIARPLEVARVRSLQLMLSKFEYDGGLNPHFSPGHFQLQVEAIGVY